MSSSKPKPKPKPEPESKSKSKSTDRTLSAGRRRAVEPCGHPPGRRSRRSHLLAYAHSVRTSLVPKCISLLR